MSQPAPWIVKSSAVFAIVTTQDAIGDGAVVELAVRDGVDAVVVGASDVEVELEALIVAVAVAAIGSQLPPYVEKAVEI